MSITLAPAGTILIRQSAIQPGTRGPRSARRRSGFTLIEVLVVVAIIALLISILLPSLRKARELASITICKAGLQQVGTSVANYQTEYKTYVPVVFGFGSGSGFNGSPSDPDDPDGRPARTQMLSVALHKYSGATRSLGGQFDPNSVWTLDTKKLYWRTKLPPHYACPFVRDKKEGVSIDDSQTTNIGGRIYTIMQYSGQYETCQPFQWEGRVVRGEPPISMKYGPETMPPDTGGPANSRLINGRPRYSALSFNRGKLNIGYNAPPGFVTLDKKDPVKDPLNNMARTWSTGDVRRVRASSMSDVTTLHCWQGQHMSYQYKMFNPGSHAMNGAGGTNAAFADNHVEWVKGTMIGW